MSIKAKLKEKVKRGELSEQDLAEILFKMEAQPLETVVKDSIRIQQGLIGQFETLTPEQQKFFSERFPILRDKASRQAEQIRLASEMEWVERNPELFAEQERQGRTKIAAQ